jgi:hypothetical protein
MLGAVTGGTSKATATSKAKRHCFQFPLPLREGARGRGKDAKNL